jgi:hypothetical protein
VSHYNWCCCGLLLTDSVNFFNGRNLFFFFCLTKGVFNQFLKPMELFTKTLNHMGQFCIYSHQKVQSCGCCAFSSRKLLIIIVFIITLFSMVLMHTNPRKHIFISCVRVHYLCYKTFSRFGLTLILTECIIHIWRTNMNFNMYSIYRLYVFGEQYE